MATQFDAVNDEALMARVVARDHPAFAALVRRHSPKFYAVAYRSVMNKGDAEDIVQEAFVKLWNKPDAWDPRRQAKFTTWFYQVVVNACIDHARKHKPLQLPENYDIEDTRDNVVEAMAEDERNRAVTNALKALPENQRMALNLCVYEALPQKEAAQVMGISVKALESLLVRAKEQLKRRLGVESEVRYAG